MDHETTTLLTAAVDELTEEVRKVRAELDGLRRELLSSATLIADLLQGR